MNKRKSARDQILERYTRTVMSGIKVQHYADCSWWSAKICTCGLLGSLQPYADETVLEKFPEFWDQVAEQDARLYHVRQFEREDPTIFDLPEVSEEDLQDMLKGIFKN